MRIALTVSYGWVRVELYLGVNMLGSKICEIMVIYCDPYRCALPDGIMMRSVIVVFTGAPKSGPVVGPLLLFLCGMQLDVLDSAISLFMSCCL